MNNIQLYVVLFMVAASILSSIVKKAKEAAEQRRAQLEIERRRLEALRTGRADDDAREEDPAAALAKRREAQLEELRRIQRERARAQASGGAAAGARTAPARVPQTPQRSQPRAQPLPKAQSIPSQRADRNRGQRPQPQRQQVRPQDSRTGRQASAQTTAEMFAAMERQRLQDTGESTTHRIVGDAPAASAAAAKHLPPSTGNPWRDAFLMQELLGPPLSMREARTPGLDSL
ncbi:MAG: hypothetical protein IT432_16165 [Phycisphaerales bacterium]|nr:hypothetical protein [Phycisphaerales bacterium]